MNNAVPTVAGANLSLQGLNVNLPTVEIPKVSSVADATRYPGTARTQDVLLDTNDPEIAYFRLIDANGFVQVDRRRCVPEPEPTPEQINDARYLSRQEFATFMEEFRSFRKEMTDNVRVLAETDSSTGAAKPNGNYSKNASGSKVSVSVDKERK